MIGTIVNTISIITGSLIGGFIKTKLKEEYKNALFNSIGLCAFAIGISSFSNSISNSKYPILFIISIAFGTFIGTVLNLDEKFNKLTGKIGSDDLSKGLTSAILLFCIGTLSILGPVQSALYNDNTFLYTNAGLDFVTSIILSSGYGVKIMYSAIFLFLFQGGIYLISSNLGNFISNDFFTELMIVGGLLILSTGISILKIKDLKTINMLPSLIIVPIAYYLAHLISKINIF